MAIFVESTLEVRFPAIGKSTTNLTSWMIDSAYLVSTDEFEFEIYDPAITSNYRLEMQPVELYVNGAQQLLGRVDITEVGGKGRAVRCMGRDYVADIVEGNVDPKFKLKPTMTVAQMLTEVLGPYGIDTIIDDSDEDILMSQVRAGIKPRSGGGRRRSHSGKSHHRTRRGGKKGRAPQDIQPKPGQGAYEYINPIIARMGATLQPGPTRGSICVTEPNYDQSPLYSLYRTDDPTRSIANNIDSATARRDFSKMPTFTLFNATESARGGQGKGVSKTFDIFELAAKSEELLSIINASTISGRWEPGKVANEVRDQGKLYRLLNFRDDAARTQEQLERAADRAVAERIKDTLLYEANVKGHLDIRTGAVFSIDTMVSVIDELCSVREELWIARRKLAYEDRDGAMSTISCLRPDSFVIDGSLDE